MLMITSDRVQQTVRVIQDAARKAAEGAITDLINRGVLREDNFQRINAQGDKVTSAITLTVTEILAELAENMVGRLKLISGAKKITLAATNGTEVLGEASDVFNYIDGDFKNWKCNVKSAATGPTPVQIYEQVKDGTFAQIFGAFGENLDRLCLPQSQIKGFVRNHSSDLRMDDWTFFLFKVGQDFFVAYVHAYSDGNRWVFVFRFDRDSVWRAGDRHRFVIPQLIV